MMPSARISRVEFMGFSCRGVNTVREWLLLHFGGRQLVDSLEPRSGPVPAALLRNGSLLHHDDVAGEVETPANSDQPTP
jgi:hypothetical protein